MKSIKLSDGQEAFVDDEDFDRLNKYEWHPIFMNGSYHAFRFVMVDGEKCCRLMEHDVLEGTEAFRYERN